MVWFVEWVVGELLFGLSVLLWVLVNVLFFEFVDLVLVRFVELFVIGFGLLVGLFVLEVIEDVLFEDVGVVCCVVRVLHVFGVFVAFDDFGVGYFVFGYFIWLLFDVFKLDW